MDRDFYKEEIEKQAALGTMAAGIASKIGAGAKAFAGMGATKRILTGSAIGGTLGGLTHKEDSGRSRLSSVASGALMGGATGGLMNSKNLSTVGNMAGDVKKNFTNFKNVHGKATPTNSNFYSGSTVIDVTPKSVI